MQSKRRNECGASGIQKWVVALCAAFVAFASIGMFRAAGVFFVEMRTTFDLSRQQATWALSVQQSVFSLTGVASGLLTTVVDTRYILFLGNTVLCLGFGLSYFYDSFEWLLATYSIMFGIGAGLLMPASVVILNRHYQTNRATVNGIFLSGDSISLFVMPPFIDLLIGVYGLRGTFLILAGIFLNLLPVVHCMSTRPPEPIPEGTWIETEKENNESKINNPELGLQSAEHKQKTSMELGELLEKKDTKLIAEFDVVKPKAMKVKEIIASLFKRVWSVAKQPMFLLVTTVHLYFSFVTFSYCSVILDHSILVGNERSSAIYVTTVFAAGDLAGRLGFGWITDCGFVRTKTTVMVGEIVASLALLSHVFLFNIEALFLAAAVLGLMSGISYTLCNVMFVQYLGVENLGISMGLKNLIVGTLASTRPIVVGWSMRISGSYLPMMAFLSGLSMLLGLLWLLEPWIQRRPLQRMNEEKAKEMCNTKK